MTSEVMDTVLSSLNTAPRIRPDFSNGGLPNMRCTTSITIVLISLLAVIPSQPQSNDPTDLVAVKQVEESMGKAMVAGDIDKLNQIYADDFVAIGSSGGITTKQDLASDFESFHDKLEWFETGPMDVQVFGNVAAAQGLVKEKTPAVSFYGRISSRSAQASGWSGAARAPEWFWPTTAKRKPKIRPSSTRSNASNRIPGMPWWPATSTSSVKSTPTIGQVSHPPARCSPRRAL